VGQKDRETSMIIDLRNKRAIVTGSTVGIGFAIARGLAQSGAAVVLNGRGRDSVTAAQTRLVELVPGADVDGIAADLASAEGVTDFVRLAGDADILVNNLGIFEPKPFEAITDADWHRFFDTNVMSGIRLSRHYLPKMLERNWGRIVFISSESALNIPVEMIHYGMTKTAQLAISRGLAESLAGTGVTVNSVLPGPTRSEGVADFFGKLAKEQGTSGQEMEAQFIAKNRPTSLLRRLATSEEVANMVAYVASPLSSATNELTMRTAGPESPARTRSSSVLGGRDARVPKRFAGHVRRTRCSGAASRSGTRTHDRPDVLDRGREVVEHDLHLSGKEIGERGRTAPVRHVHQVQSRCHLEQLAGHMARGAIARGAHVDLARVGFGIGDELRHGSGRNRWIHLHHQGTSDQSGNRRDVAHEIEVEALVERCVDGVCRADQQKRVAVRERFHHRFGADVGTRARPVLNDEGLAEPFRQPLAHQACGDVGRAAGRESDDQPHRARRIRLRSRNPRCRERSHSGSGEIC